MFGRRIFCSAPIPKVMYSRLNINTSAQAARMLPSMVPLTTALCAAAPGELMRSAQCSSAGGSAMDITPNDPVLLKAMIDAIAPLQFGYMSLMELWGISRMAVVNKMFL